MNKLETMFDLQKKLQGRLGTWSKIFDHDTEALLNESMRQKFVNQMILAMMEEVTEIMRETAYKNPEYVEFGWKKGQTLRRDAVLGEVVDLWHFMMNICLAYGFTAEDFYTRYCEKNNINYVRQDNGY